MSSRSDGHIADALAGGKRCIRILTAAFGIWTLVSGAAQAQGKPINVLPNPQALEFALVGSTATSGTITIDSSTGTKTAAGGALALGGLHTRAHFQIRGEKNRSFSIILPGSITITAPGGATTTITGFESTPAVTGTLDNSGKASVYVGAVLQVGVGQTSGVYASVFDITVQYLP